MNVLIIGGSSDIGISLAKYFKRLSYNVIVTYNHHTPLLDDIEVVKLDVTDELMILETFKDIIDRYNHIDILINMAAISMDNSFLNKAKEEFMNVLEVNLVGTFLTSQIYSRYIDNGMIINISSTDGIDTFSPYSIDYSASKAGVINMSKSIALATSNKVYSVCPNWIDSDSTSSMDRKYLDSELKRINQSRLITKEELNEAIYKIIKMNEESGSIFRIDVKGGELWIEKI